MNRPYPPSSQEWDVTELVTSGRDYLANNFTFEQLASQTAKEATVHSSCTLPYRTAPKGLAETARQIIFCINVSPRNCDLFYNSRDGLRGRYWQSPDVGFLASKYFIELLFPKLLLNVSAQPPKICRKAKPMSADEMRDSLKAASAKVWPYERGSTGNLSKLYEDRPQISVPRWEQNENASKTGKLWRWCPHDRDLEIKGALIDQQGREHIPDEKQNRSYQIQQFGFT